MTSCTCSCTLAFKVWGEGKQTNGTRGEGKAADRNDFTVHKPCYLWIALKGCLYHCLWCLPSGKYLFYVLPFHLYCCFCFCTQQIMLHLWKFNSRNRSRLAPRGGVSASLLPSCLRMKREKGRKGYQAQSLSPEKTQMLVALPRFSSIMRRNV